MASNPRQTLLAANPLLFLIQISANLSQRLRGLDALRGLAALAVVLFHFTSGYEVKFGPFASRPFFYLPNGHFGVELFFCISGFVILGTIERTSSLQRFSVARFARIYPAYFVCSLLTLATIALTHYSVPGLNAKAILINATMLAGLTGSPAIDPSYWTLTYEVLFYAFAATVWTLLPGRKRLEVPCLAWLACSLFGHLITGFTNHHRLAVLLNVEYANLFVIGMMLYYLSRGSRNPLTIPTLSAALLMALFPPEYNGGDLSQTKYTLLIMFFGAAIWLVSDVKRKFLDIAPLVFLGEISYSLYLIHQVVGLAMIRALLAKGLGTNAAILIALTFVIGLAFCLRLFVEKPAERWIKNFAKQSRSTSQTPQLVRAAGSY